MGSLISAIYLFEIAIFRISLVWIEIQVTSAGDLGL